MINRIFSKPVTVCPIFCFDINTQSFFNIFCLFLILLHSVLPVFCIIGYLPFFDKDDPTKLASVFLCSHQLFMVCYAILAFFYSIFRKSLANHFIKGFAVFNMITAILYLICNLLFFLGVIIAHEVSSVEDWIVIFFFFLFMTVAFTLIIWWSSLVITASKNEWFSTLDQFQMETNKKLS